MESEMQRASERISEIDPTLGQILLIDSCQSFVSWLKKLIAEIQADDECFLQDPGMIRLLKEILHFTNGNYEGHFIALGIKKPDSPEAWRLLAHVLYSSYPARD